MRRSLRLLVRVVAATGVGLLGCSESAPPPASTARGVAAADEAPKAAAGRGRAARAPAAELIESARRWMGDDASEGRCGPYRLVSDVPGGALLDACERIGSQLDAVYRQRFGLEPVGEPEEAILLFGEIEAFRAFVREEGGVRIGYAGFAAAPEGYLALHADEAGLSSVIDTLAHELTHLVHRRALGPGLAPWLSEGLADAVGDAASLRGLEPLAGLEGVEGQASRLRGAYRSGEAGALERLVRLDRSAFDRGVRSFDYEQSALFVRFLLLDDELAERFRGYLGALAAGSAEGPQALTAALEVGWPELERRFIAWLG